MNGAHLKQQRKSLGLSIAKTSLKLGISARTLCRWELLPELSPRKLECIKTKFPDLLIGTA